MRVGRPAVAGHLDAQFPAVHDVSVQGVHGILAVALVVEANKGEASTLPRVGVARYVDVADVSVALKDALHIFRGGAVSQVVHFQGGHPVDNRRGPAVAHGEALVRGRPRLLTSSAEKMRKVSAKQKDRLADCSGDRCLAGARFLRKIYLSAITKCSSVCGVPFLAPRSRWLQACAHAQSVLERWQKMVGAPTGACCARCS